MPSTTVNIDNARTSQGTVTVLTGTLQGDAKRLVTLQANAAEGFEFDKWEIITTPIVLQQFAAVGQKANSVNEVCNLPAVKLTTTFYTDGSSLYTDEEGKYPASVGYWQAGVLTYYYYDGVNLPTVQTCIPAQSSPPQNQSPTGGGQSPTRLFPVDGRNRGTIDEQEDTARGPIAEQ
jgi:hypothetical protein